MKVREKARKAGEAARELSSSSKDFRNAELERIAQSLEENREEILEANRKDLSEAEKMVEEGDYSSSKLERLGLDQKFGSVVEMVRSVRGQEDVIGKVEQATELDEGLELYRQRTPVGVVGSVFESRPDALVQIASLCLKSGNAVVLKGGSDASRTNRELHRVIDRATETEGWIQLVEAREDVEKMLELDELVDLLVPRGSSSLVRRMKENSSIQVLGHAEGLCHMYLDREADMEKAVELAVDAKIDYPAACNAIETLLVHSDREDLLAEAVRELREEGVEVVGCKNTAEQVDVRPAEDSAWDREYGEKKLSVRTVDCLEEAVRHVHRHGSGHTDAIVTEDADRADRFIRSLDSSSVMWNASTRFADGYRYGMGAEIGISTGKLHARGPVGLEGLTTYRYVLEGSGQTAGDYSPGDYIHREISRENRLTGRQNEKNCRGS